MPNISKITALDGTTYKLTDSRFSSDSTVDISSYVNFVNATVSFTKKEVYYKIVSPNHVVVYFNFRGSITDVSSDGWAFIDFSNVPYPNKSELDVNFSEVYLRECENATVDSIGVAYLQVNGNLLTFGKTGGTTATKWKTANDFYLRGLINFYYHNS